MGDMAGAIERDDIDSILRVFRATLSDIADVLDGPHGGEIRQNGRQVLTFRRQSDGGWRIAAAIFNADQPAG